MEGLESMTPLESEKKDLMARLGEIYYKKCKESGNVTAEEAKILEKIAKQKLYSPPKKPRTCLAAYAVGVFANLLAVRASMPTSYI